MTADLNGLQRRAEELMASTAALKATMSADNQRLNALGDTLDAHISRGVHEQALPGLVRAAIALRDARTAQFAEAEKALRLVALKLDSLQRGRLGHHATAQGSTHAGK